MRTFLTLLFVLALSGFVRAAEPSAREVSGWGQQLRQALEAGRIAELKISGSGWVKKTNRYTNHFELYSDPTEIRAILQPAIDILDKGKFKASDVHNLATFRVAFSTSVPEICPSEATQFVIDWTMPDFFYVGCAAKDFKDRKEERLARIQSHDLDSALRKYFPQEFTELGIVPTVRNQ